MRALILWAGAIVLSLASFTQRVYAQEVKTPFLEWKPIRGAAAYVVQVRDTGGKVILEKTVGENKLEVELPPGKYQQRVSALNKFRKPTQYSDWVDFNIRVAELPDVEVVKPTPLSVDAEKKGERAVAIEGTHLTESTKVFVETDRGKVEPTKVEMVGDNKLIASFDSAKIDQGKHDIILENPHNKIVRVENALKIGEDKKITTSSDPRVVREDGKSRGHDTGREPGKDTGKDSGKDTGKDTGKDNGKVPAIEPMEIYPEYKPTKKQCGRAGICIPAPQKYAWNLTPQAFVPGLSRIRAGDKKGYVWPAVIGTFLVGAGYEDRHADKVAKLSQSQGLGSIFATPLVLGTYSLWTNGYFLLIAQDQYKNIRNQRAEYRRSIQNRNILLAGALATFGMAVIDGALMSDSQGFFYTTPGPGVGPIPGTRNLSNSTFTWKFTKDVWIPGRVRRNAGDSGGTVTLAVFGTLGAATLYESYHQYQLVRTSHRLKDSVANQAVTNPVLSVALSSYWTNPGFVYAIFDSNRQFTRLRNEYHQSRQVQIAAIGTAAFLYVFQVLDAASYSSSPNFFGPAPFEPGTNPPPMADMYCFGGPCVYSTSSTFRLRGAAFIPGRARIQNGDKKAGYVIAGSMIGFGALAVFEDYEANKARRAAIKAGNNGVNALFSSQLAVAAGYQFWTSSSYLFLYQQYYHDVRKQSRAYSRAVTARTAMLGGAAILYGLQFLDANTLPTNSAAASPEKPIGIAESSTFTESSAASQLLGDLKKDLRQEAVHGLVQDRIEFKDRFAYDVAEFHKTFSF